MLKTNSAKARENVRAFITREVIDPETGEQFATFQEAATYAAAEYKRDLTHRMRDHSANLFAYWLSCLPSCGLGEFYNLGGSAVKALGDILDETEQERARYSESDAERVLSLLIFREIERAGQF